MNATEASNENTYQGWKNRETWFLSLWFNNNRGLYNAVLEINEYSKRHGHDIDQARENIVNFFKGYMKGDLDKIEEVSPLIRNMICFDNTIDYESVADGFLEDYEEVA